MGKLKLTVNEAKTRVCKLPEEKFDFLGYTFGRCYSPKTGRSYTGTVPSKKRVIRICEAISEMTGRNQTLLDQEMVVGKLNRTMIGWANYFCLGPVSKAYRAVDQHARKRLRQWLCAMDGHRQISRLSCSVRVTLPNSRRAAAAASFLGKPLATNSSIFSSRWA